MSSIGTLVAVTLDCPDPAKLAEFYQKALGWEVIYSDENSVFLSGDGGRLGLQRVDDYSPPDWPGQQRPQQLHLDIGVDDVDRARGALTELGATSAATQPGGDYWHVMLDPAGHPFCITASY